MKVSLCLLTIDRLETTMETVDHNLKCMGSEHHVELLWADNGSTDHRVVDYVQSLNPAYQRLNGANEGVAAAFNQLLLRSTGDYICLFPNDILLPWRWLDLFVLWASKVENPGLVGMECTTQLPPLSRRGNVSAHFLDAVIDKVFGVMFFPRAVLDKIGGFHEGFVGYGGEDSDFNNRINLSGFNSFYIPGIKSQHIGNDVGDGSEYRKMKDDFLIRNMTVLGNRMAGYEKNGTYEPLPEKREPL